MLRLLAAFLLLNTLPVPTPVMLRALPGSELLEVQSPSRIQSLTVPNVTASGAMLIDIASGEEIFSKNPDIPRPMASLTKIMTALVVLEQHSLKEIVVIPSSAEGIQGSALRMSVGEHFALRDLLKGLLLPSANDVAYALAVHDSKSAAAFTQKMNERAKALGLKQTKFANPAGLDDPEQYSTPRDLSWLTLKALKHPTFQEMVQTKSALIRSTEGSEYELKNTNEILHSELNVFGVKTGTTGRAGECLIILFTEGRRSYALVLLGSKDRYTDALTVMQAVAQQQM